jgi:hypothetical protein
MTIFDLHAAVLSDYRDFVRSFIHIADARIRDYVERALDEEAHLWPDFLLQLSPAYQRGASVDDLAQRGSLHPDEWREANGRIKTTYRERIPRPVWVQPDGTYANFSQKGALKMWFQPQPFSADQVLSDLETLIPALWR